ncbi:MAG TPA: putative peptidoglycan glycosyltransferase FtsW [Phycisphaerae bacterium]|nr:putative peptidoglycan glycosyltransferase FtsW [Phycisphaerae bacterium]HRY67041.1 putative peptidoglycan glycosyltransferase FtsW [Phycisphaerae bacterium]HSA27738.1 putative peptidoglycan glycosyltransferase FtsW [Phycisphaerae bacterium]
MSDVLRIDMMGAGGMMIEGESQAEGMARGRAVSISIVSVAVGLMAIGAVMTFSAASGGDRTLIGWPFWKYPALRQVVFLLGALVALLVTTMIPYRLWCRRNGWPTIMLLGLGLATSVLVLVPGIGQEVNNARRWIRLGPESLGLQIQPSEIVKMALPLFLAFWIAQKAQIRLFLSGFLPAVVAIGLSVGVVGIEDFGTAALLAVVGGAMLLVGGAKWSHMLFLVLPAVPAFGYLLLSRAHRMDRLVMFLDIWRDPEGKGYQAIQSLCTISSGGWWGRGLGAGFVKGYLPAARTDFIFAVICEELGIVGAIAVIGLLIALLWNGRTVFVRCGDPFGRLLAFGITLALGVQSAINIAVVTVSVPTKGIALPLVSAGGSGAIILGALVGILASIPRSCPSMPALEQE